MTERWEQILERYGQTVTVYPADGGAGAQCRAFLQPIREKGQAQSLPSPLSPDQWTRPQRRERARGRVFHPPSKRPRCRIQ